MEGYLVTFDIRADLANEIKQFAKQNGMFFNDYLAKLVEDAFYTEKYGDLNVIFRGEGKNTKEEEMVELKKNDINESKKNEEIKEEVSTNLPHISKSVVEKSSQENNDSELKTINEINTESNDTVKFNRVRRRINAK